MGATDLRILESMAIALQRVGNELDRADRSTDYDPWPEIARMEELVRSSACRLSEHAWQNHPSLAKSLSDATDLHLHWGVLQDQITRMLSSSASPSPDISS